MALETQTANTLAETFDFIDGFIKAVATRIGPAVNSLNEYLKRPEAQNVLKAMHFYSCAQTARVIEHPVLITLFPEGFTADTLHDNWDHIRQALWEARPASLMVNNREERYRQLLTAHSAEAYIAVCRGTYPEIERLLRDKFLIGDPAFHAEFDVLQTTGTRTRFIQTEMGKLRSTKQNPWAVDLNASLEDVGIFTTAFMVGLENAFDGFDPRDAMSGDIAERRAERHIQCHGWADKADFSDGLTALFLFDMALQMATHGKVWEKTVAYNIPRTR